MFEFLPDHLASDPVALLYLHGDNVMRMCDPLNSAPLTGQLPICLPHDLSCLKASCPYALYLPALYPQLFMVALQSVPHVLVFLCCLRCLCLHTEVLLPHYVKFLSITTNLH